MNAIQETLATTITEALEWSGFKVDAIWLKPDLGYLVIIQYPSIETPLPEEVYMAVLTSFAGDIVLEDLTPQPYVTVPRWVVELSATYATY